MSRKLSEPSLRISYADSIEEIQPEDWNRLAAETSPFLKHEFLLALEATGCTTRESGWQPHHVKVHDLQGALVGVVPLYRKTNSYGEYVFDWSWADAYRSNGLAYYPKFLTAIPFTPSESSRFLLDPKLSSAATIRRIADSVMEHAEDLEMSSWHVLFPTEEENQCLQSDQLMSREGCQFHWFNRGYRDFDDFLAALSSRKRKNIRKERQSVFSQGIKFQVVRGGDISETQWKHFFVFYQSTYLVRGMQGYLNQEFFMRIGQTMPDNLFLVLAKLGDQIIAGALFFQDDKKLFGRYWGSLEEFQFLHFETCFYQGIEYCIQQGLSRFDAGAQGEHKIQRGFEPVRTFSNHWLRHPSFAAAIGEFLQREKDYMREYRQQAKELLPFRKS